MHQYPTVRRHRESIFRQPWTATRELDCNLEQSSVNKQITCVKVPNIRWMNSTLKDECVITNSSEDNIKRLTHECILSFWLKVKLPSLKRNKFADNVSEGPQTPDFMSNESSNCDFNNPSSSSLYTPSPPPLPFFPLASQTWSGIQIDFSFLYLGSL